MLNRTQHVLLPFLLLFAASCATTTATTNVHRAPWISFKGAKTVAVDVTTTCSDVVRGPDKVDKSLVKVGGKADLGPVSAGASFGISVMVLAEQSSACTDDYASSAKAIITKLLSDRLVAQGYQVVQEGADQTLHANVDLSRSRTVDLSSEREDKPEFHPCADHCGTAKCLQFSVKGLTELNGVFVGPTLPKVSEQRVERKVSESALAVEDQVFDQNEPGTKYEFVCAPAEARKFQDPSNYNWAKGMTGVLRWLNNSSHYMLQPYDEQYGQKLFKVSDSDDTDAGLDAGKAGNWQLALEKFNAAAAASALNDPKKKEGKARAIFNVAAATMQLGDLAKARELAEESRRVNPSSESDDLIKEIIRRVEDIQKL